MTQVVRRKTKDKGPRESAIVDSILKYLNGLPGCCAAKRHGSPYGIRGEPDITGAIKLPAVLMVNGGGPTHISQRFEIEVKRPGEKPTESQLKRMEFWRRCGATVIVADCVDDVRDMINALKLGNMSGEVARIIPEGSLSFSYGNID